MYDYLKRYQEINKNYLWNTVYADTVPYRECELSDHINALGDFSFDTAFIGLRCIQCSIFRSATIQYFDLYSLQCQDGAEKPKLDLPKGKYPLAHAEPVCRFCQMAMLITKVGYEETKVNYNVKWPTYVYELCWPDTVAPFYVGQTTNIVSRYRQHCLDGWEFRYKDKVSDKAMVLGEMLGMGVPPLMVVQGMCHPSEAKELETSYIIQLTKSGVPLTNRNIEGSGLYGYAPGVLQKEVKQLWDNHYQYFVEADECIQVTA